MADITPDPTEKKDPVKTPNIPNADADLRDTAQLVSQSWHDRPGFTLLWITQTDFDHSVSLFKDTLASRLSVGSSRPEFTVKLSITDQKIDTGASRIKDYLIAKYGKVVAKSYYAAFGIVKIRKGYVIPPDRDNRKNSLELILPALTLHGFDDMEYGHDFWTQVQTDFLNDLSKAISIDGNVSTKVGSKENLKKQIRKVLNALINLLKANYPDAYKSEMRSWGFQKEKY
jgi:hypothetical protein